MRDVVDLDRYPLDELDGDAGRALVERCRTELDSDGACVLPSFLTDGAVAEMVALGDRLRGEAWTTDDRHTVTFEPPATDVPPTDTRARLVRTREHAVACDRLPGDSPIRRLYEWPPTLEFVRRVLGLEELHRSADLLDAVNIARFDIGDELGWHFDNSHFSVTLMYQPADQGGTFEYVPRLRTDDDPNHEGVAAVLDGAVAARRLDIGPGALSLFRGHCALHRVTPVAGRRPRYNSVLTYRPKPGMTLTPETRRLFYGRDR